MFSQIDSKAKVSLNNVDEEEELELLDVFFALLAFGGGTSHCCAGPCQGGVDTSSMTGSLTTNGTGVVTGGGSSDEEDEEIDEDDEEGVNTAGVPAGAGKSASIFKSTALASFTGIASASEGVDNSTTSFVSATKRGGGG